jgi:U4/U6 small nuclear ribonucleoprotein PRP3
MVSGVTNNSNEGDDGKLKAERKRKRRWGDAAPALPPAPAATAPPPTTTEGVVPVQDAKAKALALQESIRARLAALKAKTTVAATATTSLKPPPPVAAASLKRPPPAAISQQEEPSVKRAKHYELDLSVTAPSFQKAGKKAAAKVNPYLAHLTTQPAAATAAAAAGEGKDTNGASKVATLNNDNNNADAEIMDERLVRSSKPRKRHKEMRFVEPGSFIEKADLKRLKAANAEQSGFTSGRKAGMYVQPSNMASIYGSTGLEQPDDDDDITILAPRAQVHEKTTIPFVMEWWDVELLPSKLKKQVAAYEGKALSKQAQSQMQQLGNSKKEGDDNITALVNQEVLDLQKRCFEQAALSYSKTAALIQHIVPIKPTNSIDGPEAEPTLYLTKRELKRQRKLRREAKQRDMQDMEAAGLVAPPEPRLTLKNFIRVLGDQAFLDPSQMEQKVTEQIQARQRAHMERNEAAKLSKEERSEKRIKKLHEDTTKGVHVAIFYVKDMSHPYHRTKVDLNAQQYNITGGVLECEIPSLACVICEGGPKAIKRYVRLMTVRMKWKGPDNADDEDDDEDADEQDEEGAVTHKFNPENKCELVWQGMAVKRFFKGFVFQACETSDQARKILRAKGVGHFWDQVLTHASGRGDTFRLKLGESDDEEDDENEHGNVEENGNVEEMVEG